MHVTRMAKKDVSGKKRIPNRWTFFLICFVFAYLQKFTLLLGGHLVILKENIKRLEMTFGSDSLQVRHGGHEAKEILSPLKHAGLWNKLRESHIVIGGLLGEIEVQKCGHTAT